MSQPMLNIQRLARNLRQARDTLCERATTLHDGMEQIKRRAVPGLRSAVASVTEAQAVLEAEIRANPHLFIKPRSVVFEGVKLGFQKGKGKIEWEDDGQVVRLIKKHFPDSADVLIRTTEKPVKDALQNLTAAELKRLGVNVEEAGDTILIKDTTTAVDKLVAALLKGAEDDARDDAL